jgi:N-acetyl-anhydromuramyl-L-alanine amidase AmpD
MRRLLAFAASACLALACASSAAPASGSASESLDDAFSRAATESGVPRDLLVAIARVEGGLTMPKTRTVDPASQVPVAGPLELRRGKLDTLALGAKLLGVSEEDIRRDADLGLRAGALVLADLGRKSGARDEDYATWVPALEDLSGYADQRHRAEYARRVLQALGAGGTFEARGAGLIALMPNIRAQRAAVEITVPEKTLSTLPDYPGAEVFPTDCTNKCDTTRGGASVGYVVIHDTEGGWDASVSTLQNDPGKSVQYIVNTDGTVGQFVPESYTAWHAGNYWYNQRSVGIEHVGYYTKTYPEEEYAASAKLVDYLTQKYGVATDRDHIIGHDQVPNGNVMAQSSPPCEDSPATCETGSNYGGAGNHRDPGDWEWCTYMPRFGGTCKCDDVWNLWNCSSSGTQAFRCDNGQVELKACTAGCVVEPVGQDDQCNQSPTEDDGGAPPPEADAQAPAKNRPASDKPAPNGDSPQGSGGCSASAAPPRGSFETSMGALFAALFVIASRRRSRR